MFQTPGFIFRKAVVRTRMVLNHTCTYNRLPEDESSGSKHAEDI